MDSGMLDVPGARLYHERRGAGPVLLVILGGASDAAMAGPLADVLSDRYTVITYDRRGLSRSPLPEPAAEQRIETHADDALRLLEAEPAYVFASHSGAMIGLDLLARHPERVRRLVAHEPPAFELLPDAGRWRRLAREAVKICDREGPGPAMAHVGEQTGVAPPGEPQPGLPPWVGEMLARIGGNLETSLRYEMGPFSAYVPDQAALREAPLVVAYGADSEGRLMHRATLATADLLGRRAVTLPGDHVGYLRAPAEFAGALHELLSS
ncbi:alpha/beta hydrolase [Nonomuraea sp. NPDC050404]|uniref:alpha/beta fold hydrolase n=1 Tax=Nonomuraea sp. NPDC050404 TaxID=3155783 RepID=UPI003408396C